MDTPAPLSTPLTRPSTPGPDSRPGYIAAVPPVAPPGLASVPSAPPAPPAPPPPAPIVVPSVVPPAAPAAEPVWPAAGQVGWVPFDRWCEENGFGTPKREGTGADAAFVLTRRQGTLRLVPGSQQIRWEGQNVWLGHAPQFNGGRATLHALDAAKTLWPLLRDDRRLLATNRVVVLDPGHGGENSGAVSVVDRRTEKEFTLDWARRLRPLLEARGWTVFLTRTNDIEVPLPERVSFAEERQAGLFLSLHFNSSAGNGSQGGIETYCLTPAGLPSSVVREFADDPALVFPNNAHDADNVRLAVRLHGALLRATGAPDRGVRRARFLTVLRGQNRPAVLLEGGYLSHPREARLIASTAYRQQLAEAVADALGLDAAGRLLVGGPGPDAPASLKREI